MSSTEPLSVTKFCVSWAVPAAIFLKSGLRVLVKLHRNVSKIQLYEKKAERPVPGVVKELPIIAANVPKVSAKLTIFVSSFTR